MKNLWQRNYNPFLSYILQKCLKPDLQGSLPPSPQDQMYWHSVNQTWLELSFDFGVNKLYSHEAWDRNHIILSPFPPSPSLLSLWKPISQKYMASWKWGSIYFWTGQKMYLFIPHQHFFVKLKIWHDWLTFQWFSEMLFPLSEQG